MLSKGDDGSKPSLGGRRRASTQKPLGIAILDSARAQDMAIVLSKLKVSPEELCRCLQDLDFSNSLISIEDLELLELPTPDEAKELLESKNIVAQLQDVEQKVMPFCTLPRSAARLRLMKLGLSHAKEHARLMERCETL